MSNKQAELLGSGLFLCEMKGDDKSIDHVETRFVLDRETFSIEYFVRCFSRFLFGIGFNLDEMNEFLNVELLIEDENTCDNCKEKNKKDGSSEYEGNIELDPRAIVRKQQAFLEKHLSDESFQNFKKEFNSDEKFARQVFKEFLIGMNQD